MLGWAIQGLALAQPLLTGARLSRASESSQEAILGSELLLDFLMIWSLLVAAVLGFFGHWFVGTASADDPLAAVRASTWRMLVALGVVGASLWLVEPPDFVSWGGVWRPLATFLAVGPVPLWACGSLLRSRGVGVLRSALISLLAGGVAVGGIWLLGRFLFLHDDAALAPLGAVGVACSVGLTLACWERVPGRWPPLLGAILAVGMAVAAAMAVSLTRAPASSAWVQGLSAIHKGSGRMVISVAEPNTRSRLAVLTRDPVTVTPLSPRTEWVHLGATSRAEIRRSWRSTLFGGEATFELCAVRDGEPECVARPVPGRVPLLATHPRLERVVAVSAHELLAWDLDTDRVWVVRREGQIRWPCLTREGMLIWRMQTSSGPYRHEAFSFPPDIVGSPAHPADASDRVEALPLDHGHQCDAGSKVAPDATFVRGRERLGRLAMLSGPGLPAEGVHLEGTIGSVRWSDDGRTIAFVTDSNQAVRFYNEAWGLTDPLPIPSFQSPELSSDGRWMSRPVRLPNGDPGFELRSVPDGEIRFRRPSVTRARFDARGAVFQVWDGILWVIDAETGEEERLFPPP